MVEESSGAAIDVRSKRISSRNYANPNFQVQSPELLQSMPMAQHEMP
jgi:hypothetical protein